MVWTKEEEELIAVLDSFINSCAKSEEMQNVNYYLLLQQVLSSTKGEVSATKKYCNIILDTAEVELNEKEPSFTVDKSYVGERQIKLINNKTTKKASSKIKSFWATLFIVSSLIVIFFSAKRSPNLSSNDTVSNVATFCPTDLIEKAQKGIVNQDKVILEEAIASLQELKHSTANQLGVECQQTLWETQYVYAINFLASEGERKPAVEVLCSIPAQYYQDKDVIPWLTRWSNTNSEFERWLQQYQATNDCSAAVFLQ